MKVPKYFADQHINAILITPEIHLAIHQFESFKKFVFFKIHPIIVIHPEIIIYRQITLCDLPKVLTSFALRAWVTERALQQSEFIHHGVLQK